MRTFLEEIVLWTRNDQREGFWVCPRKTGCPKHGNFDKCQWNHWGGIQFSDKPMYSMSFIWAVTSTSSSWLFEVVPQEAKNDIGSWIVEFASCLLYCSYWSVPNLHKTVLACICLHKTGKGDGWDPQQLISKMGLGCWDHRCQTPGNSALWSPGRKTRDVPPTFKHGWNPLVFVRLGGALVSNRAFCFASSILYFIASLLEYWFQDDVSELRWQTGAPSLRNCSCLVFGCGSRAAAVGSSIGEIDHHNFPVIFASLDYSHICGHFFFHDQDIISIYPRVEFVPMISPL